MYGIILACSIFTAILLAQRFTDKKELLWGGTIWVLLGGVIGARVYHVLSFSNYYSAFPSKIFDLQNGGVAFLGALIGGMFTGLIYLKIKKEPVMYWLNLVALVLPIAQIIGRLGNFINSEIYGLPSKLPWAIYIPVEKRPEQFKDYASFHPLFLYEMVLNLLLWLIIVKNKNKAFYLYITGYGGIRFILEFLRIPQDTWVLGTFNVAQVVCIMMLIIGVSGLLYGHKKIRS